MRTGSLASSQSCRSIDADAWYKRVLNKKSLRWHLDGSAIVHYATYLVPVGDEGDGDVLLVVGGAQELHGLRDQHVTVDVTSDVRDQHDNQRNLHH